MIIPIGHESNTVRRWPWVTFALMAACLLIFVVCLRGDSRAVRLFFDRLADPVELALRHPYLRLDRRVEVMLMQALSKEDRRLYLHEQTQPRALDPDVVKRQQAKLDEMLAWAFLALDERPTQRFALVPASPSPVATVTHMFLHGGWFHLLGNLLFLYLVGPFVEDRWGRVLFSVFYLLAGALSVWVHVLRYPDSQVAVIGASGAIAGIMGAFLIRFWRTRIQFFYWFGPVVGTFRAPAFVMLALWFGWELLSALVLDALGWGELGGVAHWVHVGGFAVGVGVALAMGHLKVEEHVIQPALDARDPGLAVNQVVEGAFAAREGGRKDDAYRILLLEANRNPDNLDAVVALWHFAVERGTAHLAAPHLLRLVQGAVRRGDAELAVAQWLELVKSVPDVAVDAATGLRLAEMMRQVGYTEPVRDALERAARGLPPAPPAAMLVRLAKLARECGAPGARDLVVRALAHPDLAPRSRTELEQGWLAEAVGAPAGQGESATEAPVQRRPPLVVEVTEAVPVELGAASLHVAVGAGVAELPYSAVTAVSVVGIQSLDGAPFAVVDLLLDPPGPESGRLRVVRLSSRTFDPRRLVAGEGSKAAFRRLVELLLERSGAIPLPNAAAVRGERLVMYPSLERYQLEALGAAGETSTPELATTDVPAPLVGGRPA